MDDAERIRRRYEERDASAALSGFWTLSNPVVLHVLQERERVLLPMLGAAGIALGRVRLLDVGCGTGIEFANFERWGARHDALFGVDLMRPRLASARERCAPALAQAEAGALPFADASFDLVCQHVVFSSIVEAGARRAAATEMLRVLRPGGHLLWYDAFRARSTDPHFRPVPRDELHALFPGVRWTLRTLTSDVGIAARAARWLGVGVLPLLDALRVLRTHLLGIGVRS